MRHDDLAAEFESWAVQEPSADFSVRTALFCRAEAHPLGLRGLPRGLFRVLLAALLLSAGAYAASRYSDIQLSQDDESAKSEPHDLEPGKVSVYATPPADAFAEPEKSENLRVKRRAIQTRPVVQDEVVAQPMNPAGVHHPRCYCGTSAVVCFCSD
jgi:hypothetical protein